MKVKETVQEMAAMSVHQTKRHLHTFLQRRWFMIGINYRLSE